MYKQRAYVIAYGALSKGFEGGVYYPKDIFIGPFNYAEQNGYFKFLKKTNRGKSS